MKGKYICIHEGCRQNRSIVGVGDTCQIGKRLQARDDLSIAEKHGSVLLLLDLLE